MSKKIKKTDDDAGEEKPSGGKMGLLVLAVAAISTSFGVTYFLAPADGGGSPEACASVEPVAVHAKSMAKPGQTYVPLEEVLITIGSEPATRYLKMNLSVVTDKDGASAVGDAEPVLKDTFLNYLRSIELDEFEDPAFYPHMREQLSRRSELVLGSAVSDGVLITEFLLR